MSRILAHVHVYYPELWPEINSCLGSLSPDMYDLYVTSVQEHPEIARNVKKLHPSATYKVVPNLGYDVGPFIDVLNQINLNDYDYVIKLHTKRDMPKGSRLGTFRVHGTNWRKWALSFLSPVQHLTDCLNAFSLNTDLGICAYHRLIVDKHHGDAVAMRECRALLERMNLPVCDFKFVAGTMFLMRAKLLKPLKDMGLKIEDFPMPTKEKPTTLAHTLERLFGALTYSQGMYIADPFTPLSHQDKDKYIIFGLKVCDFLFRSKTTKSGRTLIKILKIPIYSKR